MPIEEEKLDEATRMVATSIKTKLLEKGLTQTELARMLKVNRSSVSLAISGSMKPKSQANRKRIYQILDMNK